MRSVEIMSKTVLNLENGTIDILEWFFKESIDNTINFIREKLDPKYSMDNEYFVNRCINEIVIILHVAVDNHCIMNGDYIIDLHFSPNSNVVLTTNTNKCITFLAKEDRLIYN